MDKKTSQQRKSAYDKEYISTNGKLEKSAKKTIKSILFADLQAKENHFLEYLIHSIDDNIAKCLAKPDLTKKEELYIHSTAVAAQDKIDNFVKEFKKYLKTL